MEIDDSWTRDTAPTFLSDGNGKIAGCNWRFNGWGGKYPDFERDARLAERLLDHLKIDRYDAPFVLEGGAIHSDGQGTILTTESVLLNENRNPGITRTDMERLRQEEHRVGKERVSTGRSGWSPYHKKKK